MFGQAVEEDLYPAHGSFTNIKGVSAVVANDAFAGEPVILLKYNPQDPKYSKHHRWFACIRPTYMYPMLATYTCLVLSPRMTTGYWFA